MIKPSRTDHSRAGAQAFMERHPRYEGRCYLVAPQVTVAHSESTASGVGTLPLDLFLLAIGAPAEQALARNVRVSA